MSEVQPTLKSITIFPSRKRQRVIDDDDLHIEPPCKRARKHSPGRASVIPPLFELPLLKPIIPPSPKFEATENRKPKTLIPPPSLIPRSYMYDITPLYAVAETPASSASLDTPAFQQPFAPIDQDWTSKQLSEASIFSDAINEFYSTANKPLAEHACETVSDEGWQDISIRRWLYDINAETTSQEAEPLQDEREYNIAMGLMQPRDNDSPGPVDSAAMALMVSGQTAEDQLLEEIGALQPPDIGWNINREILFAQNEKLNESSELMYVVDSNNRPIEDEDLFNFYNPNL